jgi:hypothetical protein
MKICSSAGRGWSRSAATSPASSPRRPTRLTQRAAPGRRPASPAGRADLGQTLTSLRREYTARQEDQPPGLIWSHSLQRLDQLDPGQFGIMTIASSDVIAM